MTACAKLTASASAPRRPSRTSRRQVNNWPADNPYLRAVADTRRGALALSATIRRFSSGVQRRRAPVWITSSRDTFDIVVCSVIRLCLRGFIPQRKAAVAGGLRRERRCVEEKLARDDTPDPCMAPLPPGGLQNSAGVAAFWPGRPFALTTAPCVRFVTPNLRMICRT